jgi:hypothetical protein
LTHEKALKPIRARKEVISLVIKLSTINPSSNTVTLVLVNANYSRALFDPHLDSIKQRNGEAEANVVLLDYTKLKLRQDIKFLASYISDLASRHKKVYLDGLSYGAKMFVLAIAELHRRKQQDVLDKLTLNCINGIMSPKNIIKKSHALGKFLPHFVFPIMTPIIRIVYDLKWRQEGYQSPRGSYYSNFYRLRLDYFHWGKFKDRNLLINTKSPGSKIRIGKVVNIGSLHDRLTSFEDVRRSLQDLFYNSIEEVVLPTGHATLIGQSDVWRDHFYTV